MFVDIIHSLSDFDAALGRARVPLSIPESPSRSAMFDLDLSDTEASPSSLEGRFDFPCTPVSEDPSKQFLIMDPEEEDKMMKTAASEIAKNLDLPVCCSLNSLLSFVALQSVLRCILRHDCGFNLSRNKVFLLLFFKASRVILEEFQYCAQRMV